MKCANSNFHTIPKGGGEYLVKPAAGTGREISLKEAARRMGVSPDTAMRLFEEGLIRGKKRSRRKTVIYADSVERHQERTRKPGFWKRQVKKKGAKP